MARQLRSQGRRPASTNERADGARPRKLSRKAPRGMTERMHLFVYEYLSDPHRRAARAYLRAGFKAKNVGVASSCASRLLNDARVKAEIARALAARLDEIEAGVEQVLRRLAQQAFTDITDIVIWGDDGQVKLRPMEQLTPDARAAISKIVLSKNGVRVDLGARDRAMELLARHLGVFRNEVAVTGPEGEPLVPLETARAMLALFDKAVAEGKLPPVTPPPGMLPPMDGDEELRPGIVPSNRT